MLVLQNATQVVFFEQDDRAQAEAFRDAHPEFKGRQLRGALQARPNDIECGKVYTVGRPEWSN
jgi:hypothetical protein